MAIIKSFLELLVDLHKKKEASNIIKLSAKT